MTRESQPSPSESARPSDSLAMTTARFQVIGLLGTGGMASVYEVLDQSTQQRLALKRLHPTNDPLRQRRMLELFEREFYTLSQISHPYVVAAYDYGVDERGAYYTMELLRGGVLQTLAPLPFKRACRIARDVCSALSLLHSRRLVYRDLNPRNVHCTPEGVTKLLDFGATASMGPCLQVVGTPAYCAPEAIDLEPLDARTDLYSLGATLYFAITGQHAYPAKTFGHLREVWDSTPLRPSEIVASVPAALDALIMELLKLDRSARPANAGELMEQLAGIEGLTVDEQVQVPQAYLSTPSLVGREALLAEIRTKLRHARRGHGQSLLFTSGSGMGRTRFLGAAALEAKMQGTLVLRAAATATAGDYGLVRALGLSLLEAAPELAARAAADVHPVLRQILPELAPASSPEPSPEPIARASVLEATRGWFSAVARERPLMIAVDDFHSIDEPSAACLTWLAREADKHRLLIAVTCETDADAQVPAALKLYESTALTVRIANLSASETEELLGSVFGSVPNLQMLARELQTIAAGNPRDTLQLAQHLVDRGVVRYRSGAWSLPASLDDAELPSNMAQAMRRQFEALPARARDLGSMLSLAKDRPLSFDECVSAHPDRTAQEVHVQLQELVRAQFVKYEVELLAIAHRGLHTTLQHGLSAERLRAQHRKLAEIFAGRRDEQFRRAKHSLLAGEATTGIDALVAFSTSSQQRTDVDPREYTRLVLSLPDDWLDTFNLAIDVCAQLQRPWMDRFVMRMRLASVLNVMGAPIALSREHFRALLQQLSEDSGLGHYASLDASLPPGARLMQALTWAKQRYDVSAEDVRGLDPQLAIRSLTRVHMWTAGMIAVALEQDLYAGVPSLEPLRPLSAAIDMIQQVVSAVTARVAGQQDDARAGYLKILERLGHLDLAGFDGSNHRFLRFGVMYGLASIEAGMGLASCLTWAQTLETEPLHEVNALQVQLLYDLWLGRVREANEVRERIELRRIQSSARQMADGTHLLWQMLAHAYSDDLTHLKQVNEELRPFAQRHAGWAHVLEYANAEYHRIRGDFARASEQLRECLNAVSAGTHQVWPHAAAAHISVLCALERADEAATRGAADLAAAERAGLGSQSNYIRMALAVALAQVGERVQSVALADSAIESFLALGSTGLNLVLAYEARCRVAILAHDRADYDLFAERCAEECARTGGHALQAKLDRLVRAGSAQTLSPPSRASAPVLNSALETNLRSAFTDCDHKNARAERALQMLLMHSGSSAGCLYLMGKNGAQPAARVGGDDSLLELATMVDDFIDAELQEQAIVTASLTAESNAATQLMQTRIGKPVLVLLSHQTAAGMALTGVATLIAPEGLAFVHPGSLAARLSRMLAEFGDVSVLTAD